MCALARAVCVCVCVRCRPLGVHVCVCGVCVCGVLLCLCLDSAVSAHACVFLRVCVRVCGVCVCMRSVCACLCCGIPPHKPRPGRVRGEVVDGIYRRHPPTGDREHHFSLPNQRDWGTPVGWSRSHVKRATRTDRRDREPWRARKPKRRRPIRGSRRA